MSFWSKMYLTQTSCGNLTVKLFVFCSSFLLHFPGGSKINLSIYLILWEHQIFNITQAKPDFTFTIFYYLQAFEWYLSGGLLLPCPFSNHSMVVGDHSIIVGSEFLDEGSECACSKDQFSNIKICQNHKWVFFYSHHRHPNLRHIRH